MTPCIIESPYAGDVARNRAYLQRCIRWCLAHGLTPYASHQMLTEALDDLDPEQRAQGLAAGVAMARALVDAGALHLVFVDLGVSAGMWAGLDASEHRSTQRHAIALDGVPRAWPTGVKGIVTYSDGRWAALAHGQWACHLPLHDATTDTWGPR